MIISFLIYLRKSISMKNKIIDSSCKSDKRETICEDENKINYTFSHLLKYLKHYTTNLI